ncbi:hypothetical protein CFP56_009316 [Quercus suber]|uniref:Uncharacterized protein n=1 Tax=Quercus suber TaxID=58331 RepID=A0AAW0L2V7_QUESU
MEITSKAEVMKPALLKVSIPLAISVAGFVCARIMSRRSSTVSSPKTNVCYVFNDEDSFHSFPSTMEDEEPMVNDTSLANMKMGVKPKFEEILGFRSQIEDLERRAWELEKQFVSYCDLKEQESLLTELKNMVLLEIAHVEFLDREISSAEAENERLRNLVVQYVGVLEYIEHWKSKNGSLQRKVKRLLRRTKQQSRVKRDQNMKIEATEAEILRNCDGLETRFNVIKKLEEEVRELHKIMIEGEVIAMENYNELGNEPEQLQKDRAAEVGELIF